MQNPSTRNTWFGVELRHLAALAAVAEEGSFRGAADALGYVQSAVSAQLAHLEQLLEVRLVERQRGPGPVYLTDAGTVLLAHTKDILPRFAAARADLDLLKDGRAGRVRLGVSDRIATTLLPELVLQFRRRAPAISIDLVEVGADDELWTLLETGGVDAAVCDVPVIDGPFECQNVLVDPYVLAISADSPWAATERTVDLERLSRLPLIDHRLMRHVEAQLCPAGFEPRYIFQSDVTATVRALVAGGVGAAILPRLAVSDGHDDLVIVGLEELVAPRCIAVCWNAKRELTPGVEHLVAVARAAGAQRSEDVALALAS